MWIHPVRSHQDRRWNGMSFFTSQKQKKNYRMRINFNECKSFCTRLGSFWAGKLNFCSCHGTIGCRISKFCATAKSVSSQCSRFRHSVFPPLSSIHIMLYPSERHTDDSLPNERKSDDLRPDSEYPRSFFFTFEIDIKFFFRARVWVKRSWHREMTANGIRRVATTKIPIVDVQNGFSHFQNSSDFA